MIGLEVKLIDREAIVSLEGLPNKLQLVLETKMKMLIDALRMKVESNLAGRILQTKSGDLLRALNSGVEKIGSSLVGFVDIETSDKKVEAYALAHEYGGKGYYEIVPIAKQMLRFVAKSGSVVFTDYVWHPPAQERSYLRSALEDEVPIIESGLDEALRDAIRP